MEAFWLLCWQMTPTHFRWFLHFQFSSLSVLLNYYYNLAKFISDLACNMSHTCVFPVLNFASICFTIKLSFFTCFSLLYLMCLGQALLISCRSWLHLNEKGYSTISDMVVLFCSRQTFHQHLIVLFWMKLRNIQGMQSFGVQRRDIWIPPVCLCLWQLYKNCCLLDSSIQFFVSKPV